MRILSLYLYRYGYSSLYFTGVGFLRCLPFSWAMRRPRNRVSNNVEAPVFFCTMLNTKFGARRYYNTFSTMQFSGTELSAIFKMGIAMCAADGRSDNNEMVVLNNELARFRVSTIERLAISEDASKMEFSKAVSIISNLILNRKNM